MTNCIIVSIHKRTVMNGTSPGQIRPVHILISLANKHSCNLVIREGTRPMMNPPSKTGPELPGTIKSKRLRLLIRDTNTLLRSMDAEIRECRKLIRDTIHYDGRPGITQVNRPPDNISELYH